MRMLPKHLWAVDQRGRKGEAQIFRLLQLLDFGDSSVALHSQNVMGGHDQAWSEIDFLLLLPQAIVGLEVKAGKVVCQDGVWYVLTEEGTTAYSKHKSPFVQISNALDHFRSGWFKTTFADRFTQVPFVKLSILCGNNRPQYAAGHAPPELPDEFTLYAEDLQQSQFKQRVLQALTCHIDQAHVGRATGLLPQDIDEIAQALRPDIDLSDQSSAVTQSLAQEQTRLTREQYCLVDQWQQEDRLLVNGGAGTGKTHLLIYAARKALANKQRVLVVTKSSDLSKFLHSKLKRRVCCLNGHDLAQHKDQTPYDLLLVAEGQDLCNPSALILLNGLLHKGLSRGRWRWFGDFENQFNPNQSFSQQTLSTLKSYTTGDAEVTLKHNVRNTPEIVGWLEEVCRARMGKSTVNGGGHEVRVLKEDVFELLLSGQYDYVNYGFIDLKQVVLLYVYESDLENLRCFKKIHNLIRYIGDIESFKGIDAMFVFIVGLESVTQSQQLRDLVYKSVSRARSLCFIRHRHGLNQALIRLVNED
jgi:hypothetical protein